MYIVAIAWIYVVLMMSVTEHTVVAALMTFLLYGVVPVSIILYLMGASGRKRRRLLAEKAEREAEPAAAGGDAAPASEKTPS